MTGVTSGQRAFITATDSDDVDLYGTTSNTANLQEIDDLFHNSTGHNHDASGEGAPIGIAGLAAAVGNFGAWTAFTPTMTQGAALTVTVDYARYQIVGKDCRAQIGITISSAGTANNAIVVASIPAAMAPRVTGANKVAGYGTYSDIATQLINFTAFFATSTTLQFIASYHGTAINGAMGTTIGDGPTAANTDVININLEYELA